MTLPRRILAEVLLATAGGLLLFVVAASFGFRGPLTAALLEESCKAALLLAAGALGLRARRVQAANEPHPARRLRFRMLGLARGLSLGLAAIALFAGIETLAYLLAFPEAGILARLFWALPVHLDSALAEALGTLLLLRILLAGYDLRRRLWQGVLLWLSGMAVGFAWHGGANLLAEAGPGPWTFALGAFAAWAAAPVLLLRFFRHAYLGGLLHGLD